MYTEKVRTFFFFKERLRKTSYLHLFPHVAALVHANLHRAFAVTVLNQQAESFVPQHHTAHPSATNTPWTPVPV